LYRSRTSTCRLWHLGQATSSLKLFIVQAQLEASPQSWAHDLGQGADSSGHCISSSPVTALLRFCGPHTIAWLVIPLVIHALN
jgi:hypothetical protein